MQKLFLLKCLSLVFIELLPEAGGGSLGVCSLFGGLYKQVYGPGWWVGDVLLSVGHPLLKKVIIYCVFHVSKILYIWVSSVRYVTAPGWKEKREPPKVKSWVTPALQIESIALLSTLQLGF